MRRRIGTLLVVASVLLMTVTVLGTITEITGSRGDLNEDQQLAFVAGLLFAGVLFVLGVTLFIVGWHLRCPVPAEPGGMAVAPPRGNRKTLAVYVGGSVVAALAAALLPKGPGFLRPLWCLVGQPSIFAQLLFGGILGIKLGAGMGAQAILITTSLAYFLTLLYPPYRMLTMDRAAETACFRRMTVLLILFGSVHLLITGVFALLVKA